MVCYAILASEAFSAPPQVIAQAVNWIGRAIAGDMPTGYWIPFQGLLQRLTAICWRRYPFESPDDPVGQQGLAKVGRLYQVHHLS